MNVNLNRLKAERVANGLTQDEMSLRMGWKSRTPYAKRELGLVPIGADELAKAAEILGYDTNSLGIFFTLSVLDKERKRPA
ncbi:MAG: helix-turn-helix transcriptional regulator [Leuconostoc sp.]|nr:helix-turn-helix transcriptional regulator [Leuconostoc sp.]